MKVIIFEDESRAANHLIRLLGRVDTNMQVIATLESVRDGIRYLQNNAEPDLIFSDIQLADGLSVEIYNQAGVQCPVIFTTAYDHYAIDAFETSGIDYLLKPIEEERLRKAIEKAKHFLPGLVLEKIGSVSIPSVERNFKSRFMVKVGDRIKSIPVEEISLFFSQGKATFIHTTGKQTYCIDYALDELEPMLKQDLYFRVNRKYIVSIQACTNIFAWSGSRLRLKIDGIEEAEIIVARERIQEFKNWLDR